MIGLKYELRVNNADRSEDTDSEPAPGYRHDRYRSVIKVSYLVVKIPLFTFEINQVLLIPISSKAYYNYFPLWGQKKK
jgi:hypothetical protein